MTISFGAKLEIDKNYGKNLPPDVDAQQLKKLAKQYNFFVNKSEACSTLIPDETIVLSSKKDHGSLFIDLDFYEKNSEKPKKETIYYSKDCGPTFRFDDLMFSTYKYIIEKFGVKQDCSEDSFDDIEEKIIKLMGEEKENNEEPLSKLYLI